MKKQKKNTIPFDISFQNEHLFGNKYHHNTCSRTVFYSLVLVLKYPLLIKHTESVIIPESRVVIKGDVPSDVLINWPKQPFQYLDLHCIIPITVTAPHTDRFSHFSPQFYIFFQEHKLVNLVFSLHFSKISLSA